jgi:hypothetical protein
MILALAVTLCGCDAAARPDTSVEARSPGGKFNAMAEQFHGSGPGNDWVETRVVIHQRGWFGGSSEKVLGVSEDLHDLRLQMLWATATHLEITIREPNADAIFYQVAKVYGIEVSVRRTQ